MVGHQPNFEKWSITNHFWNKLVGHRPIFEKWLLTNHFQNCWLATDQILKKWLATDHFETNWSVANKKRKHGCSPTAFRIFGWPLTNLTNMVAHQPRSINLDQLQISQKKWLATNQFYYFGWPPTNFTKRWLATSQIQTSGWWPTIFMLVKVKGKPISINWLTINQTEVCHQPIGA